MWDGGPNRKLYVLSVAVKSWQVGLAVGQALRKLWPLAHIHTRILGKYVEHTWGGGGVNF